jgi:RNA polymerase sigma-B factor
MAPTAPLGTETETTTRLFTRWNEYGDTRARDILICRYLPLARSLAGRYRRSSEPFDDLVQVASLGLVKAVDRFDVRRGNSFATFAIPTIFGELRRYFRDSGWAVHLPRGLQERALQVDAARERLTVRLGRAPRISEISDMVQLDPGEVLDAIQAADAYTSVSLDKPASGQEGDGASFAETHGEDDARYELLEDDLAIRAAAELLSPRERRLLHLRFARGMTQTEIAERIGVSQMQVSRLLRKTLAHLRELADAVD